MEECQILPVLDPEDYEILYFDDWYDGPLSGMLSWKGEQYWYLYIDDNIYVQKAQTRVYVVMKLSEEDYAYELKKHQLWIECSGGEGCLNDYNTPRQAPTRPMEDFYKAYPIMDTRSYTGDPVAVIYY